MSALRYYKDEHARWPALCDRRFTGEEALAAVKKLWRRCGRKAVSAPHVEFKRAGSTWSHASLWMIRLSPNADWLTLVHEVAHVLVERDPKRKPRERAHGKRHARVVDRLCRYVLKKGWMDGTLFEARAWKELRRVPKAKPPERARKIALREAQIRRLDRRIKSLTTRRRTAARSLQALLRADRAAAGGAR